MVCEQQFNHIINQLLECGFALSDLLQLTIKESHEHILYRKKAKMEAEYRETLAQYESLCATGAKLKDDNRFERFFKEYEDFINNYNAFFKVVKDKPYVPPVEIEDRPFLITRYNQNVG